MNRIKIRDQLELDICPHCGRANPTFARLRDLFITKDNAGSQKQWGIYVCRSCGNVVSAYAHYIEGEQWSDGPTVEAYFPSTREVSEDIPDKPREFLRQARDSLHAPAGAIMLCASAVDAMLKDKEYIEGKLYTRIKQAVEGHLITPEMETWAHQIRLDANDQRHADENAGLPTQDDAKRSLDFALAFAEYLFVLPAKVTRGLERP